MTKQISSHQAMLDEWKRHLLDSGKARSSVRTYLTTVRGYLNHVGEGTRLDRISEGASRAYFATLPSKQTQRNYAIHVNAFLRFAASRLPVPVPAQPPTKQEVAPRQQLSPDKQHDDELIAALTRQLIRHCQYFQRRMKGEPDNLDEIDRYLADGQELIRRNMNVVMELALQGHNIHTAIDGRVQR